MKAKDIFKVYLETLEDSVDITDGLINVQLDIGLDSYEGPHQQSDPGTFRIVTRNPLVDPNVNSLVKFNSKIRFTRFNEDDGTFQTFYVGYVTDIDVEYTPKDPNPIITINGTDALGVLNRMLITQEFIDWMDSEYNLPDNTDGLTFKEFIRMVEEYYYVEGQAIFFNFIMSQDTGGSLDYNEYFYSPAKFMPQVGQSILELITLYAQTNLDFIYLNDSFLDQSYFTFNVAPYVKYNYNYWYLQADPYVQYADQENFNSEVSGYGYKRISLSNNLNRVTNQVGVNNTYTTVNLTTHDVTETYDNIGVFTDADSVNIWNISELSIDTRFPQALATSTEAERFARDIFTYTTNPDIDIVDITFDEVKRNYALLSPMNNFFRVVHKVNPSLTLDKFYTTVGVKHYINEDEWETTYVFAPMWQDVVYQNQYADAYITVTPTSGNTNTSFTATMHGVDMSTVDNIYWQVNAPYVDADAEGHLLNNGVENWNAAYDGTLYKNNTPRTGSSVTWTYDNNGILNQPYGGNPNWGIYAWIFDTNGWVTVVALELGAVTSAQCYADFDWVVNTTTSKVDFTYNGSPDADTYSWTFGDLAGGTSTEQNPSYKYTTTGYYNVTLTINNGFTTSTHTEQVYVRIEPIPVKKIIVEYKASETRPNTSTFWNKYFPYPVEFYASDNAAMLGNQINAYTTVNLIQTHGNFNLVVPSTPSVPYNALNDTRRINTSPYYQILPETAPDNLSRTWDLTVIMDVVPNPIGNLPYRTDLRELFMFFREDHNFEKAVVYVSPDADASRRFKIGEYIIPFSGSASTVRAWSLDNKVSMPPKWAQPA